MTKRKLSKEVKERNNRESDLKTKILKQALSGKMKEINLGMSLNLATGMLTGEKVTLLVSQLRMMKLLAHGGKQTLANLTTSEKFLS